MERLDLNLLEEDYYNEFLGWEGEQMGNCCEELEVRLVRVFFSTACRPGLGGLFFIVILREISR